MDGGLAIIVVISNIFVGHKCSQHISLDEMKFLAENGMPLYREAIVLGHCRFFPRFDLMYTLFLTPFYVILLYFFMMP